MSRKCFRINYPSPPCVTFQRLESHNIYKLLTDVHLRGHLLWMMVIKATTSCLFIWTFCFFTTRTKHFWLFTVSWGLFTAVPVPVMSLHVLTQQLLDEEFWVQHSRPFLGFGWVFQCLWSDFCLIYHWNTR